MSLQILIINFTCKFSKIREKLLRNFIMKIFPRNKFLFDFFVALWLTLQKCPNYNMHQLSTMCAHDKINECWATVAHQGFYLVFVGGVVGLM